MAGAYLGAKTVVAANQLKDELNQCQQEHPTTKKKCLTLAFQTFCQETTFGVNAKNACLGKLEDILAEAGTPFEKK